MAIEKGLYAAPQGIDDELMEGEDADLEIEIVDPEMVTLSAVWRLLLSPVLTLCPVSLILT